MQSICDKFFSVSVDLPLTTAKVVLQERYFVVSMLHRVKEYICANLEETSGQTFVVTNLPLSLLQLEPPNAFFDVVHVGRARGIKEQRERGYLYESVGTCRTSNDRLKCAQSDHLMECYEVSPIWSRDCKLVTSPSLFWGGSRKTFVLKIKRKFSP